VELNPATAETSSGVGNQPETEELRANAGGRSTARILVVDDKAQVCLMIRTMLEREGYGVQLATCGREAMDMLERNTFYLVLTDIAMAALPICPYPQSARYDGSGDTHDPASFSCASPKTKGKL